MDIQGRRPTIRDVAEKAGVSPTTVSHTLNGKGWIRPETAERVRAVADEIGYRPHSIAKGLRQSKIGLISLIIRPLDSLDTFLPEGVDYFMRFAGAAALTAMDQGYGLMLVPDPTKPNAPYSSLMADACIVTEPVENDPVLTRLARERIPFVTIGADPARRAAFPTIEANNVEDTNLVLEHLFEVGAQKIAMVTGTDLNAWNIDSTAAYLKWCKVRGQKPVVFSFAEAEGERAGVAIMKALFDTIPAGSPDAVDGVYCLTGRHAAGLTRSCAESGLKIPGHLLVVAGSDAMQNRVGSPTITALDIKPEAVARHAVSLATRLINKSPITWPQIGPHSELIIRESTTR